MPNHLSRAAARLSLLACAFLTASPAAAYWEYGHETIARIALSQVDLKTRWRIAMLLRHGNRLGTPECPVRTLAEASVWADCIKPLKDASGKARFGFAYNWHFQNVDVCQPFDLTTPCANGDCVSAQIERQKARLADRSLPKVERLQALAFLTHLVGDLSQPLHAGDHQDRGGNDVKANYGRIGGRANLHSIWDGYLAERAITTPPAGRWGPLLSSTRAERRALAAGSVEDWSRDSWTISRDVAYATAVGDPCSGEGRKGRVTIDEKTVRQLIPVARRQVLAGGVRLARLLDEALR